MKRLKVFLLALLIAVMAISLAGCKKNEAEETQEPAQSVTETPEVVEEGPPESLEPIDEDILMPKVGILD